MKRGFRKKIVILLSCVFMAQQLTAVSTYAESQTKTEDKQAYLFAYFTGNSVEGEQIRFALSKDGYKYKPLNENAPVINQNLGTGSVRDPYILEGNDGYYYLIGTDLRVSTAGDPWGKNTSLVTWRSKDLIEWTDETIIPIIGEYESTSEDCQTRAWAPEAIYDKERGEYMIFWAMQGGSEENPNQLKLWYSYTKDFKTLTEEPKVLYAPTLVEGEGSSTNIDAIDANIVEKDGVFHLFYKHGAGSKAGTKLATSTSITGPYKLISNDIVSPANVEGADVFKLITEDGSDKWAMIYDYYTEGRYGMSVSNDLIKFTTVKNSQVDFDFSPRHGYVIQITQKQYDDLVDKWGIEEDYTLPEIKPEQNPIVNYDFEEVNGNIINDISDKDNHGKLFGSASIVKDEEKGAVLYLNGKNGSYAEIPQGLFDGMNTFTISMDVKSEMTGGNYFVFTAGIDNTKYTFLKINKDSIRNCITTGSWSSEQAAYSATESNVGQWMNIKIVMTEDTMAIYKDGLLLNKNDDISISMSKLGSDLKAYLGKSFYSADSYFKGYFDNFKIYNRELSEEEIADEFGIKLSVINKVSADGYKFINSIISSDENKVSIYVKKDSDLTSVPLEFEFRNSEITSIPESGTVVDLTSPKEYVINGEEWTIEAIETNNPVLDGLYADPDIAVFNNRYYIYPTSDGFTSWSGTYFKVFSSDDLVNWTDHGKILDVASDDVPWATGSAWAPCIAEKDGKYYFYYCANQRIGVAVADNPEGPFTNVSVDKPMISWDDIKSGISVGQIIDPSVFTDDDGQSYMYFGNGNASQAVVVKLNDDMVSIDKDSMQNIKFEGSSDFREAITVTKREGKYHFTWSCDDTRSENYHVRYGVSDSPTGKVTVVGNVLEKRSELGIVGTGHHSITQIPGKDEYYIAYHRMATPAPDGISGGDRGFNREVCIEKVEFDENGLMKEIIPTLEGITEPRKITNKVDKTLLSDLINSANEINIALYTEESVKIMQEVLVEAEAVYNNVDSTQEEVDAVKVKLQLAIEDLEEKEENNVVKEHLQLRVDEARKISAAELEGIDEGLINEFEDALQHAETVLLDEGATQEEVNTAIERLTLAMEILKVEKVDKSDLIGLVEEIEFLDSNKYTKDSWENVKKALDTAKNTIDDEKASKDDVAKAYDNLLKAQGELELKPSKVVLEEKIKEVEDLDSSKYTAKTWEVLKNALDDAKKVLEDEDATEKEIVKAVEKLEEAKNDLKENTTTNNNTSDESNNAGSTTTKPGTTTKPNNNKLPQTGNVAGVLGSVLGLVIGTAGVICIKKNK